MGRVRPLETLVSAVSIAILTNGPSIAISHLYNVPLGWDRWPYIIPIGIVALLGVFVLGRDLRIGQFRRNLWPIAVLAAYLLWCMASVTWSVAPDLTAVRSLLTAGVAAFGLWYGLCLRFKEQLLSLFFATATLSIWSLGLVLIQPKTHQLYPPPQFPTWHTEAFGVFGNPNSLGPVAVLSLMSSVAMWILFPVWWSRLGVACAAVVGVILAIWSQSVTAIVGLVLALSATVGAITLPFLRRVSGWVVGGTISLATLVFWKVFFDHIGRLAPMVGADATFSSRRLIWSDVRSAIALRPWRGYGFFAFWDKEELTAAMYKHVGIAYGSAHNSVLEVALGLGRVGLALYLALAFFMVVGIARAIWLRTSIASVAWVALAVYMIAQNSMESFVLWYSYLWALFVAATVVSSRLLTTPSSMSGVSSRVDKADSADREPCLPA